MWHKVIGTLFVIPHGHRTIKYGQWYLKSFLRLIYEAARNVFLTTQGVTHSMTSKNLFANSVKSKINRNLWVSGGLRKGKYEVESRKKIPFGTLQSQAKEHFATPNSI